MGGGYEDIIFVLVMEPFQYLTPCSHGDFGPCYYFICCSLDQISIKVHIQIIN